MFFVLVVSSCSSSLFYSNTGGSSVLKMLTGLRFALISGGHTVSSKSLCPEPLSSYSVPDWVSTDSSLLFPKTCSCSSRMSCLMSAIISRRRSKEPGGPWNREKTHEKVLSSENLMFSLWTHWWTFGSRRTLLSLWKKTAFIKTD